MVQEKINLEYITHIYIFGSKNWKQTKVRRNKERINNGRKIMGVLSPVL